MGEIRPDEDELLNPTSLSTGYLSWISLEGKDALTYSALSLHEKSILGSEVSVAWKGEKADKRIVHSQWAVHRRLLMQRCSRRAWWLRKGVSEPSRVHSLRPSSHVPCGTASVSELQWPFCEVKSSEYAHAITASMLSHVTWWAHKITQSFALERYPSSRKVSYSQLKLRIA